VWALQCGGSGTRQGNWPSPRSRSSSSSSAIHLHLLAAVFPSPTPTTLLCPRCPRRLACAPLQQPYIDDTSHIYPTTCTSFVARYRAPATCYSSAPSTVPVLCESRAPQSPESWSRPRPLSPTTTRSSTVAATPTLANIPCDHRRLSSPTPRCLRRSLRQQQWPSSPAFRPRSQRIAFTAPLGSRSCSCSGFAVAALHLEHSLRHGCLWEQGGVNRGFGTEKAKSGYRQETRRGLSQITARMQDSIARYAIS
jgi:hypothetical protein